MFLLSIIIKIQETSDTPWCRFTVSTVFHSWKFQAMRKKKEKKGRCCTWSYSHLIVLVLSLSAQRLYRSVHAIFLGLHKILVECRTKLYWIPHLQIPSLPTGQWTYMSKRNWVLEHYLIDWIEDSKIILLPIKCTDLFLFLFF